MPEITTKLKNHILTITLNRPKSRNALSSELLDQLFAALHDLDDANVVILTGSGTDAFCSGADLAELEKHSEAQERQLFFRHIASVIELINTVPVPVIAKVHGYALAGGCGIAAACDLVYASDKAVFGLPELQVGLGAMVVMAPIERVIGKRALSELLLTGSRIDAKRAKEINLVTDIFPKNKLDAQVELIAQKLAKNPPVATSLVKEAFQEVGEEPYSSALYKLADRSALLSLGQEAQEGIAAFKTKRAPIWPKV